jgi:hypothetical protein
VAILLNVEVSTLGPRPVSNAGQTNPAIGGVRQRKGRIGSHFRMEGRFPPLEMDAGRSHVADLLACELVPAALLIPQPELVIGTPGATAVNGAGQAGFSLVIDGATPGYTFRKGQFFNHVTLARRYLYSVQASVTANGSGQATLSVWPMLRIVPADNATLDFATPRIEGWLEFGKGWDVTSDFTIETDFVIEEAA